MNIAWIKQKIAEASFITLKNDELEQTAEYIKLYHTHSCSEHWQVNSIISKENKWDEFKAIRSLNDHGTASKIRGITPQFFAIVCKVLSIEGDDGAPLKDYDKY
jgi:hypothetical protein